jgi:hypothetical protein
MSTILKALRRLEEEKSSGTARSLDEQVVAPRPPEVRSGRWPVVGAAMIAGMGVGSLALYLWFEPAAAPPLEMPTPAVSETARVEPKLPVRAAAPSTEPVRAAKARPDPVRNRPARSVASTIEVVKRMGEEPSEAVEPMDDVAVAAAGSGANPGEPDPKTAPGVDAALAAGTTGAAAASAETALAPSLAEAQTLPAAPPPVSPAPPGSTYAAKAPSVEPKAAVVDTPLARSAPEPNPPTQLVSRQTELETVAASQPIEAAAEELPVATVPTASRPSAAVADPAPPPPASPTPAVSQPHKTIVRAQLPELTVASTTWHPDARRRFAVVNLTESDEELRLREGDAVGPLVVEMIEPGGVFFAHDGIAVRYNVGR